VEMNHPAAPARTLARTFTRTFAHTLQQLGF
jgi:hypothetical protein